MENYNEIIEELKSLYKEEDYSEKHYLLVKNLINSFSDYLAKEAPEGELLHKRLNEVKLKLEYVPTKKYEKNNRIAMALSLGGVVIVSIIGLLYLIYK